MNFYDKIYYLYCGIEQEEVMSFMRMLFESCISFGYDYEAGTITLHSITAQQELYVAELIREADLHHVIRNLPQPEFM